MRTRQERVEARRELIQMASQLYEHGDDAEELFAKMETAVNAKAGIKPEAKIFLLNMLKTLLPIILKMFVGI